MSFSASVTAVAAADFSAAIDSLTASPPLTTDEGKSLFAKAQQAAKDLATGFDGEFPVSCSISGHSCQEQPGSSPYDSISVSLYEVAAPAPPVEPAPSPEAPAS